MITRIGELRALGARLRHIGVSWLEKRNFLNDLWEKSWGLPR